MFFGLEEVEGEEGVSSAVVAVAVGVVVDVDSVSPIASLFFTFFVFVHVLRFKISVAPRHNLASLFASVKSAR